jgi:excisionase family DNA binding protein
MEKWITVTEAAEMIGVSNSCVTRLLVSGRIKGERFHQRAWMVDRSSAEHYRDHPPGVGRPRKAATETQAKRKTVKKKATASPKKKQTVRKRTKP